MSKTYLVPLTIGPRQVDFPEGCRQERKGSAHFRPGSLIALTDEEMEHLKKAHPDLAGKLVCASPPDTPVPIKPVIVEEEEAPKWPRGSRRHRRTTEEE